ncbi:MAG TPA: hypothetical protein VHH10_07785 [Rubrobacteraceae bacterium]|jgi:hypothetical protein|nr:hypothetical protein [Rubrobacteraceae bacterium]
MRKKVAMILGVATLLVAVAVSAVMAQSPSVPPASAPSVTSAKQCYSMPCYGNANREVIYERIGDHKSDLIRAFGNFDRMHANTYSKDQDQLHGFGGDDFVYVDDGDTRDAAGGGSGYDWCYVDAEIEAAPSCEKVVVR